MEARCVKCHQDLKSELDEMLTGVVPPEMCGVGEQCIYKVPPRIRNANPQAFTPHIISIGPFHNPRGRNANKDTNILWSMEDLKLNYLKGFLNRTKLSVEYLAFNLKVCEDKIRSCYAGHVIYNNKDFLKIIVTDACFIIELFLRHSSSIHEKWNENDPILSKPRLFNDIRDDLLLLENQLPFFVLEEIIKITSIEFGSFVIITITYFEELFKNKGELKEEIDIITERGSPKHFIDLVSRLFFSPSLPFVEKMEQEEGFSKKIDHVRSLSQLRDVGVKFRVSKDTKYLLDLEFDENMGVLKMPCFHVGDATEIYLRNMLAFEECHGDPDYIAQYIRILDLLINTDKDVSISVEKGIIINYMGDISPVATMINNLNKNVGTPDLNTSLYYSLCCRLNTFSENRWNKYKAIFKHEYFSTPWRIASTIAAILLLLLTLIQTICSVWSLAK